MVDDGGDLARALDAFYLEHCLCAGGLDAAVEDVLGSGWRVWMTCPRCDATLERRSACGS